MDLHGARERMVATQIAGARHHATRASLAAHARGAAASLRARVRARRGVRRSAAADRRGADDLAAVHGGGNDRGARADATDRVLEIGTGSGYQTAILARLARSVVIHRAPRRPRGAGRRDAGGARDRERPRRRRRRLERLPSRGTLRSDSRDGRGASRSRTAESTAGRWRPAGDAGRPGSVSASHPDRSPGRRLHATREGEGCVFVPLIGRYGWPDQAGSSI